MKLRLALSTLVLSLGCSVAASAQASAGAPAGANGICKDGTYSMAASKSGACNGHKGVQTWYAATPAKSAAPATKPAPAPAPAASAKPAAPVAPPTPTPAPAAKPMPPASPAAAKSAPAAPPANAAPGGGPGMVWVNSSTKVYHCPGDRYYGKTKSGSYMTESAAKAAGMKADANKPCK